MNSDKTVIGNSMSRERIILAQEKLFKAISEIVMLHLEHFQRKFEQLGKVRRFGGRVGM
jgi:hypothetical protein